MTTEERIEATLASGVEPGQSAREYLAFAAAQRSAMGLEDVSGLGKALDEALAAVEKAAGKPLMMDDAAGMKAFYAKVESAVAGAGLDGTRDGVHGDGCRKRDQAPQGGARPEQVMNDVSRESVS